MSISLQVPIPCRPKVQSFKSMKWLIECSTDKEDYERFYKSLATEILNAYEHKVSTEDPRCNDTVCCQRFCCLIEFAAIVKLDMDPSKASIMDTFEHFFYESYILCIC